MDNEFDRLCDVHGFSKVASILRSYLKPCIGISLKTGTAPNANNSKLGGDPGVPEDFEWPLHKNRPLDFLVQINLREVPRLDSVGPLPSDGMLAFFYDLEEQPWGYDPADLSFYRICYFANSTKLSIAPRPGHPNNSPSLTEKSIEFWSTYSLPGMRSRAWWPILEQIAGPEREINVCAYDNLSEAIFCATAPTKEGPRHKIGGYSDNCQGDMQLEAELVMNGLYCGNGSGYEDPRRPELEKKCEDWQLLLQLDTDYTSNLVWGDAGMIYFWVRRQELAKRIFSQAWMTLQCA